MLFPTLHDLACLLQFLYSFDCDELCEGEYLKTWFGPFQELD